MKIVLLTLSGDPAAAREDLETKFPDAIVESLSREELEKRSGVQRVNLLRSRKPDLFAVATERLMWQRGQDAFLLLGALAGARQSIILDAHGGWREESKGDVLVHAPIRLAWEFVNSKSVLRHAEGELKRLEAAIERDYRRQNKPSLKDGQTSIVYLRSSPGPGTQTGGAASHINGFLNAALGLGVRVALISNDEIAGLDQGRVPTKIIWPKPVGSTRAAFDVYNNLHFTEDAVSEIQTEKPDFIYQRYARFSWAGVAAALRTQRALFLEYNGSEVWVGRHWDRVDRLDLLARYERLNLSAAARIFVVSEVERQNLLQAGIEPEKIILNPNGVDVDRFKPGIGGDEARRELGLMPGEIVVGFVGTFGPWHGVEVLAQAITQIPRDSPLRFLLIGSGALRARVEEILREAGAADRVLMPGAIAHGRVPALLDACDILVSPHVPLDAGAEFFGSPTKLFEYMAMGRGIVASRLGQIGEVLQHEETALLVDPGNVEQLTGAILRLTTSPQLRERLGAAARRTAVEHHTWKHNAHRVIDAYRALAK